MNLYGCFLLIGPEIEPCTSLLSEGALERLNNLTALASKRASEKMRHEAYRQVFGIAAHFAVPCWSREAMITVANNYRGKDEARVRGLAARIVLGKPYGADEPRGSNPPSDGGTKLPTDKPKPRKPTGGNRAERDALRIESMQR